MKRLLLKLLLVNASFLANEAQSQNPSSEMQGKRPRSLDSLTPGVIFEKLPAVRADATIAKMDAVLDLGELRSGKNYEVEVNLVNNRSEPLKPVRATTSCNCVVGSIESLEILPGKQGSLFLRFRAGEQDLKHLARLEFDGQLFFDINLKGKVKLGFTSSHDSIILEGLHGKEFEITLAANFADIDITTVHVEPTYGYLKVKSVEAKEHSAVITLVEGEAKWVSSARELLEVNYCLRDAKSVVKSQRVDLAINSNVVFARPRMLRMQTTHCIESGDYLIVKFEVNLHNLVAGTLPSEGDKVYFSLGSNRESYEAIVSKVEQQSSSSFVKCSLNAKLPIDRCNDFLRSRNWLDLSINSDSIRVDGMKCLFVSGD